MIARARVAPAAATAFVDAAETFALRYARNAHAAGRSARLPTTSACVGREANAAAATELSSWPGFAPSPVVSLPDLASAAGVASVVLKCEGGRFGIGSFKALGAPSRGGAAVETRRVGLGSRTILKTIFSPRARSA